ncbi:MAG: DUF3821 domain-containing protein [Methanoregula sp.]|nr:DUF3821 domain-containing protein [Methanoregula sp.]
MNGVVVKTGILLVMVAVCVVSHAGALLNQVPAGGTVYTGEEGLDISASVPLGNTYIAWWSSGARVFGSSPDSQIMVTNPANFYISPTEFGSRTGNWYVMPAKTLAFNVKDPQLTIRIEDVSVNVDVTENGWVYRGDEIRFRIDSNLADLTGRGVPGAPVTIKVQGPDGGTYTALVNKAGITNSLNVPVSTTPYYTGAFWDTINSAYTPGTYTIWAECNANRMKDNYDIAGKTVAPERSLAVQEQNPLISVKVPTTNPTILMTTTVTPKPTTVVTTQPPTTVSTTATTQETVQPPVTPAPSPTPTKAAGICGICAIVAGIIGCAIYSARRR